MHPSPAPSSKECNNLHILCAGFAASTAVYIAVGWFLLQGNRFTLPAPPYPGGMTWILAVSGVLLLLAAPLGQRLLAQDREARFQGMPAVPFETYRRAIIVAFALREGAAILGLVATLLAGELVWVAGLGTAALLAMVVGWPTQQAWERLNQNPP